VDVESIKEKYINFLKIFKDMSKGDSLAEFFLSSVLGYEVGNDIIVIDVNEEKKAEKAISSERPIKFYFEWLAKKEISENDIRLASERAGFAKINVFLLTNWKKLFIYDKEDGEENAELMYSIDFKKDSPDDAATKFWILSRKDCNKSILLNRNTCNVNLQALCC